MFKNSPIKPIDNHCSYDQEFDNEQLISMINRLMDERDILYRENEYLKAKLNESVLIETINEMRKEKDSLLKLLLNISINNNNKIEPLQYQEQSKNSYSSDLLPPPPYQTYNTTPNGKSLHNTSPSSKKLSTPSRHHPPPVPHRDVSIPVTELKPPRRSHRSKPTVIYRVEGTKECLMNPDELSSVFAHVKHSHPNKKIVVYKTSATPQTHAFNQLVDEMCIKHGVELKHSQNSPFQQYRSQSLQDLTSTTLPPQQPNFDYQFEPIEKGNYTKQ